MSDIQRSISRLLHFAQQKGLIAPADEVYAANRLIDVLGVEEYVPHAVDETLETATPVLEEMLDDAAARGLIENTVNERDLFDTRIMDCVMPRPSEVVREFRAHYAASPQEATDWYYRLSIASNYIRKTRIDRNIAWKTATEYGDLDVTINLSKPEKDPRDIAKAKLAKASSYPKCLLCRENEGYAGRANHPARETHRLIPLDLCGAPWLLQYSPYTYYNEHCIILNGDHVPMQISRHTFENLACFLRLFPHYFAGSNADLPIVGGSILARSLSGRTLYVRDGACGGGAGISLCELSAGACGACEVADVDPAAHLTGCGCAHRPRGEDSCGMARLQRCVGGDSRGDGRHAAQYDYPDCAAARRGL